MQVHQNNRTTTKLFNKILTNRKWNSPRIRCDGRFCHVNKMRNNTMESNHQFNTERFTNDLMTRKEAANYLGVTVTTLAIWKCTGRYSLPVYKIGRLAKYKLCRVRH